MRIRSTHKGQLPIPSIPTGATEAHVIPALRNSLLSIGKLCDAGLHAHFTAKHVKVIGPRGNIILQGSRDPTTRMWMVPLPLSGPIQTQEEQKANHGEANATRLLPQHAGSRVSHLHRAFGSPAASTFIGGLNAGLIKLPGITAAHVRRHLPDTLATAKGHLDRIRQGLGSTKIPVNNDNHERPETCTS